MIRPLPGYVLVEPLEEEKSSGGLYLPDNSQDKPCKGRVISVGPMSLDRAVIFLDHPETAVSASAGCNEGDVVIYKKWTNQEVEHEGKKYLLVKFDELLGVIE